MKKNRIVLFCVVLLSLLTLALCACYVSKPAKMSDLIGTYELTAYTYKSENAPSDEEAENRLQTRSVKAYLIVRADGTGAYVYQDINTPLRTEGVKITYSYDSDDPSMITKITYDNGSQGTRDVPGGGKEPLGLTFGKKEKKLNYYQPSLGKLRSYTTSVTYTKVSKDTDMAYINKALQTNLAYPEFALNGLDGTYIHSETYNPDSDYQYYIVELNLQNKKAVASFSYKTDPQTTQTVESDIVVAYPADNENVVLLTFLGHTYTRSLFVPMSTFLSYETTDEDGNVLSVNLSHDGRTVAEIARDFLPQAESSDGTETPAD